jgi:hypothetical protein
MEIENIERVCMSIKHDTVTLRSPRPGDRFRSGIDLIEVLEVSDLLKHPDTGMQDYYVRINVIEVFDPIGLCWVGTGQFVYADMDFLYLYGEIVDAYTHEE